MNVTVALPLVDVSTRQTAETVLIGAHVLVYFWITYSLVCQSIIVFGIGSNIINIVCFLKQGFKEHINISLTGMAISDIGSLITILLCNVFAVLPLANLDLIFEPIEAVFIIAGMPHTVCIRITAWITAFITLERCMCIVIPLKVKNIITSRRVSAVIVCIFLILIAGQSPVYVVNSLGWKYFPTLNKTMIGIVYSRNHDVVESTSYMINNVLLNFCAFVVVIVCTVVLSIQLHNQAKWRKASTNNVRLSHQNKTIARLVVTVSVIFIGCFIPNCLLFILMSIFPEISVNGKYNYVVFIGGGVGTILESINSSVNMFVYYRMSTKYRVTLVKLFSNTLDNKCDR